jgi:Leucine-rich repeat (LRR) protein
LNDNKITELKAIYALRNIENLLLLQVAGNPVWSENHDYNRMFIIYFLPQVQFLDGNAIEPSDASNAYQRFSNALTFEACAVRFSKGVKCISLAKEGWTGLECFDTQYFENLTSLNLSGNRLANTDFLVNLPNLTELNLSKNQLRSMFSVSCSSSVWPKLRQLDLSGNRIVSMDDISLQSFPDIRLLNVGGNQISEVNHISSIQSRST